jgi:hypothetical protein
LTKLAPGRVSGTLWFLPAAQRWPAVTFDKQFSGHALPVRDHPPPLTDHHRPATFRSRGVAARFTTPALAGARVRESQRAGIELVVSNPFGGHGDYVLTWQGVQALCNATVHDTVLFRRFARLSAIDPSTIRGAALVVAAEGYAGRQAASAASVLMANDRTDRLVSYVGLQTRLLAQHDPNGPGTIDPAQPTPDLDRRTGAILRRLAPLFGRPAPCLACDLAAIGDAFAALGITGDNPPQRLPHVIARVPRLIARLEETSSALLVWLNTDKDNDIGGLGPAVAEAMQTVAKCARAVLELERAALSSPVPLLQRWVRDPAAVRASAARCDWLLDGWERVCLLWAIASSDAARRATLLEMAPLVPVLPREIEEWTDVAIPWPAINFTCRVTRRLDGGRGAGAALGSIERNEQLLAMGT